MSSSLSLPVPTPLPLPLARRWACWAVWAAAALTAASVLLVTGDVLARRLLGLSLGGSDELSGYAFAISVSWSLAFTMLERAHVRIDVLYQKLPTRLAALLDLQALLAMGVFAVVLSVYAAQVVADSWAAGARSNTPLATPLWLPQGLWVAGLAGFVLVLALMLWRASLALITGDLATLRVLAGVKSTAEEAEEGAAEGKRLIAAERV